MQASVRFCGTEQLQDWMKQKPLSTGNGGIHLVLGRKRQESHKLKTILGYTWSLVLVWIIGDTVSEQRKNLGDFLSKGNEVRCI